MKGIAKFFTLFWIVYFPTCIAFNDLDGFKWIDEIMTIILMGYTIVRLDKNIVNKTPKKEFSQFLLILLFFVVYGLLFGVNVRAAVLRDMVQWIRPFSVIYCTWILNPQFSQKQKRWMLYSMIATTVAWIITQPKGGLGPGAEFPVLGQMAMCMGLSWYLFKPETRRNMYIALALVLVGMIAPKFKFMGEVVCFIYVIFFLKKKLNFRSPKTICSISIMMTIVIYVTWERFDAYYVSGLYSEELARPLTYRYAFTRIIWEYFPFGSGMGSWGCAAAADYYSPLLYKYHMNTVWGCTPEWSSFVADAFYPTLAQLGVVGIVLFCIFWKRRLIAFNQIQDMRYYRVAWITFFCLAIEQTADTSFLSGKGMGYCMLIALCLNANRNMGLSDNGLSIVSKRSDAESPNEEHRSESV